jgi:hypothetical protein
MPQVWLHRSAEPMRWRLSRIATDGGQGGAPQRHFLWTASIRTLHFSFESTQLAPGSLAEQGFQTESVRSL